MAIVGLDFGTSNSCIAYLEGDHARLVRNAQGQDKTPSVVYFGTTTMVGAEALNILTDSYSAPDERDRVVKSIKRRLLSPPRIALPGGQVVQPSDVVTRVIQKLRTDAETTLDEAVTHAVLTRPAMFDTRQQTVLADAAAAAGITHVELIEEPVAAAIAFAHGGGHVGDGVLVYDFGGGTFDVAFVAREPGDDTFYLALEPAGNAGLGGDDLDQILYRYFDDQARHEFGRSIAVGGRVDQGFLQMCRRRKETLSKSASVTFSTVVGETHRLTSAIDRSTFESIIADLVDETIHTTNKVAQSARKQGYPVDTVLLVGGSSQIPLIARRIQDELRIVPQTWTYRDAAVALGAAYHAQRLWSTGRSAPARPAQPDAEPTGPQTLPGWYPDPSGRHRVRYFDGHDWTEFASDQHGSVVDDPHF
jgi:molecular chaperone DnaK